MSAPRSRRPVRRAASTELPARLGRPSAGRESARQCPAAQRQQLSDAARVGRRTGGTGLVSFACRGHMCLVSRAVSRRPWPFRDVRVARHALTLTIRDAGCLVSSQRQRSSGQRAAGELVPSPYRASAGFYSLPLRARVLKQVHPALCVLYTVSALPTPSSQYAPALPSGVLPETERSARPPYLSLSMSIESSTLSNDSSSSLSSSSCAENTSVPKRDAPGAARCPGRRRRSCGVGLGALRSLTGFDGVSIGAGVEKMSSSPASAARCSGLAFRWLHPGVSSHRDQPTYAGRSILGVSFWIAGDKLTHPLPLALAPHQPVVPEALGANKRVLVLRGLRCALDRKKPINAPGSSPRIESASRSYHFFSGVGRIGWIACMCVCRKCACSGVIPGGTGTGVEAGRQFLQRQPTHDGACRR